MKRTTLSRSTAWYWLVCVPLLAGGCGKSPPTYQGYMEGQFSYLSAPLAGNLKRLLVSRGDRVGVDAALFAVDSPDAEYSVKRQYHQWQSSLGELKDMQSGKRPSEIEALRAQIAQAKASAARSAQQAARAEADYRIQAISLEKLEAGRATAKVDAARVRELDSQLKTAELPARVSQLRSQQETTEALRAEYERASRQNDRLSVTTPGKGLVIDTFYRIGEWVPAGSPVVKILTDQGVKVRFFLPEMQLSQVHVGETVKLTCDGCTKTYTAKISYIAPQAEYTPPVIYSNESRSKLVFLIEAQPDDSQTDLLHPGLPVQVML
jgi:HlyD family secretion protein